jgi:glutaminyl-peptide cyclotransferase
MIHSFTRLMVLFALTSLFSINGAALAQFRNISSTYRGSPVHSYEVINSYPHDPDAYTQGLIIHNGQMYEGTGHYGKSSLRAVDLETGDVQKIIELSRMNFGEGVTIFSGKIIQLTWRSGTGYIYDSETFERIGEFNYKGEGWGITHDSSHLIMSTGGSELNFLDPVTFRIVNTLPVWDDSGPVYGLNELEYVNGEVWANVYPTDLIARINPDTGEINSWIYLEGLLDAESPERRPEILNGIAFDHETKKLYLTGKYWPRLYEVEIIEDN